MFDKIKKWFERGLWTKRMVKDAVKKHKITAKEYEIIIEEVYDE